MVVPASCIARKSKSIEIPTVDLSIDRDTVAETIVNACEEYGFFRVVNHGVNRKTSARLERESQRFFSKPLDEKLAAAPASPFGYGRKNIGCHGDVGEVEYLLLHADPCSVYESSKTISRDPLRFSSAVNDYVEGVKELACEILDIIGEGLRLSDKYILSDFIRDDQNDSFFRVNYYPPSREWEYRIGFGEHSDPQILTILRSNDVPGLQICLRDGSWVPVPSDPFAYYAIIGDIMEVFTNGRFMSVKHRAIASSAKPRLSTMYFCGPPLDGRISPLPEMVTPSRPAKYVSFTWGEYKRATYSKRLGHQRIDMFKIGSSIDDC